MTQSPAPSGFVVVEEVSGRIERHANNQPKPVPQPSTKPSFVPEAEFTAKTLETTETTPPPTTEPNEPVRVVKSVGQYSDWRKLKHETDKKRPGPLWFFFDQIRGIHRANPAIESIKKLHHEIKQELFARYLPDTLKQVGSYFARKMPKFSLLHESDLQEAAKAALWKYIDKYNPHFGTITFMQFFNAKGKSRLLGAIFDALRALQEFPREIAKQRRELKPMFLKLTQKLKHRPTPEEFLDEYGWTTVGSSGKTYREIVTDPLFSSGVFNQRQVASSLSEGLDEEEIESLSNYEARPARNIHRLQSEENKKYILGLLCDEDLAFIIESYFWFQDTHDRIRFNLNSFGKKCSLAWVVAKYHEARAILKERLQREKLESMIPGWDE
jgi:chromatin remodeling complex protein RSC6